MKKYNIILYEKGPKKGKIEKIIVDGYPDFFFWDYEEQTKVKHKVLQEYLKVWFTKLGVGTQKINYYDGFSGAGAYYDYINDEIGWGSPVIAYKTAKELNKIQNCSFFFNEACPEIMDNLKKVLNYNGFSIFNVLFTNDIFNKNINEFLDKLEKNPTPTFFMIDPYGIDVNFEIIERIMKIPRTEIVLNFMYNFFSRFITNIQNEESINKFYGNTNWQKYKGYKDNAKENALVNLYREQLKKFSKYVYQYRLSFADQNKTYYYLFHMTQNIDGCSIMKDAFGKINFGNVEFLGPRQPNPEQLRLSIDMKSIDIEPLKIKIFEKYRGQKVSYDDILDEFIDNSPYLQRQIKNALENMVETHLEIFYKVPNSKKIKSGDILKFFDAPKPKEEFIQQKFSIFNN